jgi:hypothetical protein
MVVPPLLTVVLITRNQEWNVRRLVESVLADCPATPATEVVLVDSASSDATVALAAAYPITVLSLASDQRLTAAVGRYVGHAHGRGTCTLFLDGDMELAPGWVGLALAHLEAHPDVAVVTGRIVDLPVAGPDVHRLAPPSVAARVRAEDVRHGRGAALFRRSALDEVGSFDRSLYSEEEPELALRIRRAGYRIQRLDRPIAYHYTEPRERISTLFARRRRRLFLGTGQNIRSLLGTGGLGPYLRERGYGATSVAALAAAAGVVAVGLTGGRRLGLGLVAVASLGAVGAQAARKRSLYAALHSVVHRLLIVEGTVRGLLMPPLSRSAPAPRYTVVRSATDVGSAA